MNKEIVIDIGNSGSMESMHFDDFPLSRFGSMSVVRATDIVWNSEDGGWFIAHPDTKEDLTSTLFSSYEEAREFEVRWVQECRKHNIVDLRSEDAYNLVSTL